MDVKLRIIPMSGAVELLITGTASHHPRFSTGPVSPEQVVTSELTGEELWNLAQMGYAPVRLVMATQRLFAWVEQSIGALFQSISRGELPEVTRLVYQARENCLALIRKEAQHHGAERVVGNKLLINDLGRGVIDVIGVGTAVRRVDGIKPTTPTLIAQAIIVDRESISLGGPLQAGTPTAAVGARSRPGFLVVALIRDDASLSASSRQS